VADQARLRRSRLVKILREEYGHYRITGLEPIGEGLDGKVYSAHSSQLGKVAIKVPHARWMTSGNEPRLDTRALLQQEFQLSPYLRARGLPVPEVFFMHTSDSGVDFLVAQFIESDDGGLADAQFGQLIRAIHELPVPPVSLVADGSAADMDEVLAERTQRRLKVLASITSLDIGAPDITAALSATPWAGTRTCLLHMDLRPANILVRRGHPAALLDWSNALTGDAALDLARAAEYGSLTATALAAYGNPEVFSLTPRTLRDVVYRLDTAVMLAHVFLNGAPDEASARHYIHRTTTLCRTLQAGSL